LTAAATDRTAAASSAVNWRVPAVVGPVATGWLYGFGVFVRAVGIPAWFLGIVGLEAALAVVLTAWILTRSLAMSAWLASATACMMGWLTYIAVASPWTWTGEVTLVLPAAILTVLWPVVRANEVQRRKRPAA
jgi:hypothetical protein